MIYKISKDILSSDIIKKIVNITYNKQILSLIVEDYDIDKIQEQIGYVDVSNLILRLYNGVLDVDKNIKPDDISGKYINIIDKDVEDWIIDTMYQQRIENFSGEFPLSNNIFVIDNDLNILWNGNKIGDLENGIDMQNFKYDKLLCLKGLFKDVLNPLYDFSKVDKDIRGCINFDECQLKDELLDRVSSEVREVNKEAYIYLMEMVGMLYKTNNNLIKALYNIGDVDETN